MAGKLELLLEAEKRGILPDDKKVLLNEARKRGLVPSAVEEPSNPIVQAGKDAIGGVEAAGRMLWNVPVGTIAQGVRTLGALGTGSDLPEALQLGRESAEAASIKPFTKSGEIADEALGHGYEALRNIAGQANAATSENYDPNNPSSKDSLMLGNEAANQTLGELGFDLAAFGGLMKGIAKGPRERAAKAEMERLAAEQKAAMEQAAADRAFVEARRQKVAADRGEARGLQGEIIQQRINEMNIREATPALSRSPEVVPAIPEKATLEVPEPTKTDPMSRQLGGRDLPPVVEPETLHGGLTEPNVQPTLEFRGRAEHPENLIQSLHDAASVTEGNYIQAPLAAAVEAVRAEWKAVERKLELASEARLDKTTLRSVKNGPSKPTIDMLEKRRAELSKMADELASTYQHYLNEGDKVSLNVMKRVYSMSTSPKMGGLDMAGRTMPLERVHEGRPFGRQPKMTEVPYEPKESFWGKEPSEAFLNAARKNQGGFIDPDLPTFGVSSLIKKLGQYKVLEKFKGTYGDWVFSHTLRNAQDPKSRTTLVWIKPDDFLKLAADRGPNYMEEAYSNAKRAKIREGLNTSDGLSDIPYLRVQIRDNTAYVDGHEGRHRMDIFKEKGLDLVPVRIESSMHRWGEMEQIPDKIVGEAYNLGEVPNTLEMPKPIFFPNGKESISPLGGVGKKQGGAITLSASMQDVRNGPLVKLFREAFNHIKREYPRFSELTDIRLMSSQEWKRYVEGQLRVGHITKDEAKAWMNAGGVHTPGQYIRINAEHPGFQTGGVATRVDTMIHELTHDWQDKRGQTDKWDQTPELHDLPWAERPWEKRAIQAGETAQTRVILDPRNKRIPSEPYRGKYATPRSANGFGKPNLGPSFEQFKAQMEKDGVEFLSDKHARAMYELRNEPKHTPGSPTESIGEVTSKIKGLQDLTDQYLNTWTPAEMTKAVVDWGKDIGIVSKNLVDKVINGRFVAKTHPLLKYVSSNIHRIKNDTRLKSENVLMGDAYDAKGNRIPAKDSPMYIWSRLSDKSREVINDVGQHFTNKNDSVVTDVELNAASRELHGRDMTPDEIQSYRDRRRGMDRTWKELNEYILKNPKPNGDLREPLPYLHNFWSPAEFGGKFLIFVKDKVSGEVEAMNGSYFKPDLKKLQAEFPEHTVSFIEKDIANTLNPAALEATIRYMAEPKRNAVRKALNEAMRSQGFRKHGKERKGISGWLGSEGGKKGVDNYEKVYEEYVRSAFSHIGNRELDKLHSEVADNSKVREVAPRAQLLSLESIDQARGRGNEVFSALESEVGKLLNEVRLPQSFFGDIGRVSNEIMVKNLIAFGKVSQIVAQGFQAIASAPIKGLMINAEHAGMGAGSSLATMMKVGAKTMKDLVNPSEQTLKDIIGLRREGALEANFQYDYKEYNKGEQYSIRQTIKNNPKEWLALTPILTKIEVEAVRKPAGLMFVNLLRELKYPENNIYKLAAELTDQYEATTKQYESAHIFGRTGTTGRMLRPLQSFTTTWVGTYLEALGSAVRNPTSAAHALPLLYGLGGMYLVTGLLGMPGVKEWDLVASTINKLANTTFPTGTETILRYAKSPEQRFGWLWSKLGINLGTTMAAPTMTQSVAPGVQFIGNVISALSVGARETGVFGEHNKPTQAEKREAVKGITPAATWGFTEGYYSNPETMGTAERIVKNPEAGPYVNKNNIGSVQRGDAEWNARKWLGSYTLKEAEQKARNWEGKRTKMEEQSHRSDLAELMVDQYITTGKINPKLMERAIELQYPAKDLKDAIKRDLMKRYLAEDQQLIGKGRSLKQQRAAKLLQELQ